MSDEEPLSFGSVPTNLVSIVWPDVEEFLGKAIDVSDGRYVPEDIKEQLLRDEAVLWVVVEDNKPMAAIVTRIVDYPRDRVLSLDWIGGGHMVRWLEMAHSTLKSYARDMSCSCMEASGRGAWARYGRKLGWEPDYEMFKMELTDG